MQKKLDSFLHYAEKRPYSYCATPHGILYCEGRSFRLSVCLSIWQSRSLWQNKGNVCPLSYTTWKIFYLNFSDKKSGWWERPLLSEIVGQTDSVGAETPIFNRFHYCKSYLRLCMYAKRKVTDKGCLTKVIQSRWPAIYASFPSKCRRSV